MKTISVALQNHLAGELSTLATLIKITRRDAVVKAFTSYDQDVLVDGILYKADGAFQASALENRNTLATDNLEIIGMLDNAALKESDLRAGLYDHARIDVYMCNWADLSQGVVQLRRGWLGEVKISGGQYHAELRGLHDLLQRQIGSFYTPECRHTLGDARCAVTLAAHTVTGSITAVTDNGVFTDASRSEADGLFNYGLITFTSGANAGLSMEVKDFTADIFTLWLPMPFTVAVGDTYSVIKGCDKRLSTCKNRFNNITNFGGFPDLPGVDKMIDYPDARV